MTESITSTDLGDVIPTLWDMQKRGIIDRFAIGGAFAAILHNEPISTFDLDIFFAFKGLEEATVLSLDPIFDYAREKGFVFDHEFININGWLVQFVEVSLNPLWSEAVNSAEIMTVGKIECPVIEADYLVAMWLLAGRPKDYHKIGLFVEAGLIKTGNLKQILTRHGLMLKWQKEKRRFTGDE